MIKPTTRKLILNQGFIVSGANTLTVSASDISNASLVLDLRYDRSCDASCISVYDNFVKNGGRLIVAGSTKNWWTYKLTYETARNKLADNLTVAKFGGSVTKLTNLYEV